jgi:hypothetical protein
MKYGKMILILNAHSLLRLLPSAIFFFWLCHGQENKRRRRRRCRRRIITSKEKLPEQQNFIPSFRSVLLLLLLGAHTMARLLMPSRLRLVVGNKV